MQRTLFIDTSNDQNKLVVKLAKMVVLGQPHQSISLAKHLVFSDPQDEDEDEFLGICESVNDADILIVGIPRDWQINSSMTAFIERMGEVQGIDNPFSRKQLILVVPTTGNIEDVIDLWSDIAARFDMDIVGVVNDLKSAIRVKESLFPRIKSEAAFLRIVYRFKGK